MSHQEGDSTTGRWFSRENMYGNISQNSLPTPPSSELANSATRDKLKECEDKQAQLRDRVNKTPKFPEELAALNVNTKETFMAFWQAARDAEADFDAKHEHGAGRLSKKTTSLAASAYDTMQIFSPLLNAIKDFGAPYGGMALGTLCLVFAVRQDKTPSRVEPHAESHIQVRLLGTEREWKPRSHPPLGISKTGC
jgi:hypothetical protein